MVNKRLLPSNTNLFKLQTQNRIIQDGSIIPDNLKALYFHNEIFFYQFYRLSQRIDSESYRRAVMTILRFYWVQEMLVVSIF